MMRREEWERWEDRGKDDPGGTREKVRPPLISGHFAPLWPPRPISIQLGVLAVSPGNPGPAMTHYRMLRRRPTAILLRVMMISSKYADGICRLRHPVTKECLHYLCCSANANRTAKAATHTASFGWCADSLQVHRQRFSRPAVNKDIFRQKKRLQSVAFETSN